MSKLIEVPAPWPEAFDGEIIHPELYLWDAWGFSVANELHLYCLAVPKKTIDGSPVAASQRNNYPFHVRHFYSENLGKTWLDKGVFQQPSNASDGHDARNVWSGSVLPLSDGRLAVAYTGIRERGKEKPFVQNLAIGIADSAQTMGDKSGKVLFCPELHEASLRAAGYFFAEKDQIGLAGGENNGPITAWRDPFLIADTLDEKQPYKLVWAAKKSATQCAFGTASINLSNEDISATQLFGPTTLPDDDEFTQLELPQIYVDELNKRYVLIAATTTRTSETQSESEVDKRIRLYTAPSLTGPWQKAGTQTSEVGGLESLFGMTVLKADFENDTLYCMAPYTEATAPEQILSFAPIVKIDLNEIGRVQKISAKPVY